MFKLLCAFCAFASASFSVCRANADNTENGIQNTAHYVVTWTKDSFPDASVVVRIRVKNGAIQMSDFWATFIEGPRGWASFIQNISAKTPEGESLSVKTADPYGWNVGDGYSGDIILSYTVDYNFADRQWPAGNEQVALHDGDALYTTGLPLFIYTPETKRAYVELNVPDGADATTAWPKEENGYVIDGLDRLLRNTIVAGDYYNATLSAANFELRIALVGDIAKSGGVVADAGAKILKYYIDLFGEQAHAQFMMAMLPGPNDGEAYFDSFASTQPTAPDKATRVVWASSIAHEFFHYWNGKKITTAWENRAERQWFSEGFTEYFAQTALRDLKLIDARTYDEILSQYLSFHAFFEVNPKFGDVTLRSAGERKWPNRPGVYDSGVVAAFCLDGLIRERSDGAQSLADMMRLMNERFGRTGKTYVFDDIVAAASDAADSDLTSFFDNYISDKHMLPLGECASRMGYTVTMDGYHLILRRKE